MSLKAVHHLSLPAWKWEEKRTCFFSKQTFIQIMYNLNVVHNSWKCIIRGTGLFLIHMVRIQEILNVLCISIPFLVHHKTYNNLALNNSRYYYDGDCIKIDKYVPNPTNNWVTTSASLGAEETQHLVRSGFNNVHLYRVFHQNNFTNN